MIRASKRRPRGFFVTGTDTGVGKTIITAVIVKALQKAGLRAGAMKPIETGCSKTGDVLMPSDGMFLKTVSRMEENISYVTPMRFASPLAPMAAAELEGIKIDLNQVKDRFGELARKYDAMVVEGIGGLFVPITADYFVADLAAELGLQLIIVASPFLGTINHTLLTVDYALKKGLRVSGIVLNFYRPPEGTLAELTTPGLLARLSPVPLIGVMPYMKEIALGRMAKHLRGLALT